ncbi:hypothetical protein [Qipengyuania sp.]|uniref:hypothetical protein n=1 Tax=Qipengyuania sp. TaxID=2004515 RepID=UPI00373671A1
MMRTVVLAASLALASCTAQTGTLPTAGPAPVIAPSPPSGQATLIHDRAAAARLLSAGGITLQWIDWNRRGSLNARTVDGRILLTGTQSAQSGPGKLYLDGWVKEIGTDYFIFAGTIRIADTPDEGRRCEADRTWRFAITQDRPYWRLRDFEWCDGLTDYVDIYF